MRLRDAQRAFAEGITDGRHQAVAAMVGSRTSALRSIALYRRLIRTNYREALKATYPILLRFVGRRYFDILARGYLKAHPSISGDLFFYGQYLPTFLYELQVAPTPLLVELARLEWTCHEVHQAADSIPLSQEQLQALASVDPSRVMIHFDLATRLLSFPIPVHRVWLALQPDAGPDEVVDLPLPEEETCVLVTRTGGKVQVTSLDKLDYLMLEALSQGADLALVERRAMESDLEFDFQRLWATILNQRLITGFSVRETP